MALNICWIMGHSSMHAMAIGCAAPCCVTHAPWSATQPYALSRINLLLISTNLLSPPPPHQHHCQPGNLDQLDIKSEVPKVTCSAFSSRSPVKYPGQY